MLIEIGKGVFFDNETGTTGDAGKDDQEAVYLPIERDHVWELDWKHEDYTYFEGIPISPDKNKQKRLQI